MGQRPFSDPGLLPLPKTHPLICPAKTLHGALATERALRGTHGRPQLHGSLIEVSRPGWVHQLLGQAPAGRDLLSQDQPADTLPGVSLITPITYQSCWDTMVLLGSAPMARTRHSTRITFPSTTPAAWHRGIGGQPAVAGRRMGAHSLPGRALHSPRQRQWKRWLQLCTVPRQAGFAVRSPLSVACGPPALPPPEECGKAQA